MKSFACFCAVAVSAVLLVICQIAVITLTPVEAVMGPVQKIFYVHLPLAWWSLVSFGVTATAGLVYLKRRDAASDRLAHAAAETGLVLNTLALVTGSIWARRSWGVWWTWDPRLTTALVLWFLYAGYLVLRRVDMPAPRRSAACAVMGILAFIDVPLVFLSARLWRSIHPAVFASKGGGLEPEMLTGVLLSVGAFGVFWLLLLYWRTRIFTLSDELDRKKAQCTDNR